ncbi:unnamed protein product [Effrenium voratum]|uniref:Uncharacterized protein n=1 Tax=Effrenium voratum TaxID=2562239 RepID=A0AA36NED3_9DINO|nr:unnamed protein product [Effrenium voratum]
MRRAQYESRCVRCGCPNSFDATSCMRCRLPISERQPWTRKQDAAFAGHSPSRRSQSASRLITSAGEGKLRGKSEEVPLLDGIQKQLREAEVLLTNCNQTVETAWASFSQRLATFDGRLSELDGRLADLCQRHLEAQTELPQAAETLSRLAALEGRFEELLNRLNLDSGPEHVDSKESEGLDFVKHHVDVLCERLAAEARVREAQFRRLESLITSREESRPSTPAKTLRHIASTPALCQNEAHISPGKEACTRGHLCARPEKYLVPGQMMAASTATLASTTSLGVPYGQLTPSSISLSYEALQPEPWQFYNVLHDIQMAV